MRHLLTYIIKKEILKYLNNLITDSLVINEKEKLKNEIFKKVGSQRLDKDENTELFVKGTI